MDRKPIPKPAPREKKQPKPLKRSYIKRNPDAKPLKRSYIKTKIKKVERAPSIIQFEEKPYFVKFGQPGELLDMHEPICGANTDTSKLNGLWIYVYRSDHSWLDSKDGEAYRNELKKMVQREWMKQNNNDLQGFIDMIGWSYL